MIITFCGHSKIARIEGLREKMFSAIEDAAKGDPVTFYLGGYGDFDGIAHDACLLYKAEHPASRLIFVTPYIDETYLKNRECSLRRYDEILYPEMERVPRRFSISKRNEWMVRHADYLIAFILHGWGGAAQTFRYAQTRKKPYVNLGNDRDFG